MRAFQFSGGLTIGAPAKINLFLELLGKRPDGYNELATLMVGLSLRDTLSFKGDADLRLACNRPDLSTGPDNLIVKAAQRLRSHAAMKHGASIRLVKRIPLAAGLAGGSTDAAATLLGLNRLWNAGLSREELAALAGELGSDLPFFLSLPAAWCTGRGEIVKPLAAPRSFDLVLVFPPFGCDTASVYRHSKAPAEPARGDDVRRAFAEGDVEALARSLHNRLEPAAEIVAPELRRLKEAMARVAPLRCGMSGSGSTLFALAHDRAEALRLAGALRALPELTGCGVRTARTLKSPTVP